MSTFQLFEETASKDWVPLVVDDNTVVIAGRFQAKGPGQAVGGQLLSNVWVRRGDAWKIKSTVLRIDERVQLMASAPVQPAVETTAAVTEAPRISAVTEAPGKDGMKSQESSATTTASPAVQTSTSEAVHQPLMEQKAASPMLTVAPEEPKTGGINWEVLVLLLISGFGLCAYLYDRRRRKIQRNIECVESMLG
mmetsp:Transcript_119512/g.300426  ORF Transcript_119512/g.300426 Transcript_119512/m.300426 type:complete len:194 (-) Transcript_119512:104-685(-)